MSNITSLSGTNDWPIRQNAAVPEALAPSALVKQETVVAEGSYVTAERDGYGGVGVGRDGHGGVSKLREVFDDVVGQTFYGQMLSAMRKTVDKPAYFHGGKSEEIFQAQLDQTLAERLSDATAEQFSGPLFELFNLQRRM